MNPKITQLSAVTPEPPQVDSVPFRVAIVPEIFQQLQLLVEALDKALQNSERNVTFREAAYFSLQARAHRRPSTIADLRSYIKRMCNNAEFAEKNIRHISIEDCQQMLWKHFGHSAHSFRKAQSILHSIFNCAARQQWCQKNPAKAILRPQVIEQKINILKVKQIRALIHRTQHDNTLKPMGNPLRLMLWCGIRPAEVRRLRWRDIDKSEKVVYIEAHNSKTGGARAVPLRGGALMILNEQHSKNSLVAPADWNRMWRRLRQEAGFISWQNDALRHTFASMHLKRFHNLPLLQEEMGHRNASLLQTRYLNLSHLKKAAARKFFEPEHWQ